MTAVGRIRLFLRSDLNPVKMDRIRQHYRVLERIPFLERVTTVLNCFSNTRNKILFSLALFTPTIT
jgi:hypothetical protein